MAGDSSGEGINDLMHSSSSPFHVSCPFFFHTLILICNPVSKVFMVTDQWVALKHRSQATYFAEALKARGTLPLFTMIMM